jgi:hypothetical protein
MYADKHHTVLSGDVIVAASNRPTTARAVYVENTCNFGANPTATKNAFDAPFKQCPSIS